MFTDLCEQAYNSIKDKYEDSVLFSAYIIFLIQVQCCCYIDFKFYLYNSICGLFVKVFILRKIRRRAISMYMVLEVGLDVLFIRTNHVTYVIGRLCSCLLEAFAL